MAGTSRRQYQGKSQVGDESEQEADVEEFLFGAKDWSWYPALGFQ